MSEIDPYNLGPKVFHEEQVVTYDDLIAFIDNLNGFMCMNNLDTVEREKVLATVHTFEVLAEWIGNNKCQEMVFFKEQEEDSGY